MKKYFLLVAILKIFCGLSLSQDVVTVFEFPQQNMNREILRIPTVANSLNSSKDWTICLRVKLQFWDEKCLFKSQDVTLVLANYKTPFLK